MKNAIMRAGEALSFSRVNRLKIAAVLFGITNPVCSIASAEELFIESNFDLAEANEHRVTKKAKLDMDNETDPKFVDNELNDLIGPSVGGSDIVHDEGQLIDNHVKSQLKKMKNLEIAFQILNATDAIQTIICSKSDSCEERNTLIFGQRPSVARVLAAKSLMGLLHYAAYRDMKRQTNELDDAIVVEWLTVGLQGAVVGWNMKVLL